MDLHSCGYVQTVNRCVVCKTGNPVSLTKISYKYIFSSVWHCSKFFVQVFVGFWLGFGVWEGMVPMHICLGTSNSSETKLGFLIVLYQIKEKTHWDHFYYFPNFVWGSIKWSSTSISKPFLPYSLSSGDRLLSFIQPYSFIKDALQRSQISTSPRKTLVISNPKIIYYLIDNEA